jgi:hypothetical protein
MDDLTDHLPAVIVVFRHPERAQPWYLRSNDLTSYRAKATRYATHSAARKAMRQAQRDLRLATWTPTLEPAESTPR